MVKKSKPKKIEIIEKEKKEESIEEEMSDVGDTTNDVEARLSKIESLNLVGLKNELSISLSQLKEEKKEFKKRREELKRIESKLQEVYSKSLQFVEKGVGEYNEASRMLGNVEREIEKIPKRVEGFQEWQHTRLAERYTKDQISDKKDQYLVECVNQAKLVSGQFKAIRERLDNLTEVMTLVKNITRL